MSLTYPSYLKLLEGERLKARAREALELLRSCSLCPRRCGADRTRGELGECRAGLRPAVSSCNEHHGEEPPISGLRGSGTIFLTNCNMKCIYCQNYPISQLGHGNEVSEVEMAEMMLSLQRRGCHNVNFVTPTHYMPQILAALALAAEEGLTLPVVYNTGGYELVEVVELLEGIVDIYMPDMRYASDEAGLKYSGVPLYATHNRQAVREMHRQVGDLQVDELGVALRGLVIRLLVLPDSVSGTEETLEFIAKEISSKSYISLMAQYFPAHEATGVPPLNRRITREEYRRAFRKMQEVGLDRGWAQRLP
ncbi:MAG: radical SAM protein [Candidatus Eiseniibacteriota bacterium]|nr:MAG: radical SAM protein [Candidatus Eisenbacteria bacterium]